MNHTTRTFPRTLESAFGPYQRHGLVEQQDPMPKADKLVVIASAIGLLVVGILAITGVIQ
jgi:hypothetical protein